MKPRDTFLVTSKFQPSLRLPALGTCQFTFAHCFFITTKAGFFLYNFFLFKPTNMKSRFTLYFKSKHSIQSLGPCCWYFFFNFSWTSRDLSQSVNSQTDPAPVMKNLQPQLTAGRHWRLTEKERACGRSCEMIFANTSTALIAQK